MNYDTTPLEQINNKITAFIQGICDKLASNIISPSEIPFNQLCELILTHFSSSAKYIDITQKYHEYIDSEFFILQEAIKSDNNILCKKILENLILSLQTFVYTDKNLLIEREYSNLTLSCAEFSHEQYDKNVHKYLPSNNAFNGKGVIYTAITGGYDQIHDPEYVDPSLDYICFTDNPNIKTNIWTIRPIESPLGLDNIRLARYHKIMCENFVGEYDYSIWVDGKIKIIGDMKDIINKYHVNSPLLCFAHYERDCIYDEAMVCKEMGKGNPDSIDKQISRYKEENYPTHNGLVDTCVLIRKHGNENLINMLSLWWNEVKNQSVRDQLSFNYACYKTGFEYDLCNLYLYGNPYFVTESHT